MRDLFIVARHARGAAAGDLLGEPVGELLRGVMALQLEQVIARGDLDDGGHVAAGAYRHDGVGNLHADDVHLPHVHAEAVEFLAAFPLDELDDEKREVFVLAELEQMTAKQIADAMGTNTSTVYSRLRAARLDFEKAAERFRLRDAWRVR